jgi:hypothetical protein
MSFESLMGASQRLSVPVETLLGSRYPAEHMAQLDSEVWRGQVAPRRRRVFEQIIVRDGS